MSRRSAWWSTPWATFLVLSSAAVLASQDTEEPASPMTAAEVVQLFGSSVVLIQAELPNDETLTGSGFFVDPGGGVATSLHLVDNARSLVVRFEGGRFEARSVRAFDIERDLALIQTEAEGFEPVVRGDTSALRRGDLIYVVSNPLGLTGTVSEGLLGAWREPSADPADELDPMAKLHGLPQGRLLQISAPLSPGSSGAPVFDKYGRVVGIVAGGLGAGTLDLNFAVPIEALIPLLDASEGWDLASLQETVGRWRRDLADPHLKDARFYLANEELDEAARALDRALGVFPRCGEALTLKGEVLLKLGRIEEAEVKFRSAVDANPESAEAWEKLGGFLLMHDFGERHQEAVAAFKKALELDPWRADSAFGLGICYLEQGLVQEGRAMLERAVESDREHLPAWVTLGQLCVALGDWKAAEEAFESALWVDRDNARANCGLGTVYFRTGDDRAGWYRRRCEELSEKRP